ncbi:MAG: RNA polymerase sigma factor [Gemmataceae bacterium]
MAKFTPLVIRIVQRVLGPSQHDDWEDASQTIFLRIFSNLHKWDHKCPFCKWLAVVAARRAIDFTRVSREQISLSVDIPDKRSGSLSHNDIEQIETIIANFPEQWREVWNLSLQGISRKDIARRVGRSVRTVQYWLAEMFEQIQEQFGDG